MVELWTRESEASQATTLDLRDVAEALHISDDEARVLLSRVRGEPVKRPNGLPLCARIPLFFLLAWSLVYAAAAIYFISAASFKGQYLLGWDKFFLTLSLVWTFYWLLYFRRNVAPRLAPLVRTILSQKF